MTLDHQYVDRRTGRVMDEPLLGDRWIGLMYGPLREHAPSLFRLLVQARTSSLLAGLRYDLPLVAGTRTVRRYAAALNIDLGECLDPIGTCTSMRRLFERRIRYWETRPEPEALDLVVSPADARVLVGSLRETDALFVKNKFFSVDALFGLRSGRWLPCFAGGEFAVFRLTPDKYHYNHAPVCGRVVEVFEVDGDYHSCNPTAALHLATPCSMNRRVVTIIDTDGPGGTGVGLVAMVEVVALMIGQIRQCYSGERYHDPRPVEAGLALRRGAPKSLYMPGSSTDILLFQPGRIRFAEDLLANSRRTDVRTRYCTGLARPVVETDLRVREPIACRTSSGSLP